MKKGSGLFDVTMGAYDGAEICELVGTYILHQITSKYNKKDIGLYRDDGLAIFKNISGQVAERIKRTLQRSSKIMDCKSRSNATSESSTIST